MNTLSAYRMTREIRDEITMEKIGQSERYLSKLHQRSKSIESRLETEEMDGDTRDYLEAERDQTWEDIDSTVERIQEMERSITNPIIEENDIETD